MYSDMRASTYCTSASAFPACSEPSASWRATTSMMIPALCRATPERFIDGNVQAARCAARRRSQRGGMNAARIMLAHCFQEADFALLTSQSRSTELAGEVACAHPRSHITGPRGVVLQSCEWFCPLPLPLPLSNPLESHSRDCLAAWTLTLQGSLIDLPPILVLFPYSRRAYSTSGSSSAISSTQNALKGEGACPARWANPKARRQPCIS